MGVTISLGRKTWIVSLLISHLMLAGCSRPEPEWQTLFDGKTLNGWIPKIRGHESGLDPYDTFRVEDGLLTVSYENYERFEERFGHIFYETPYTHYRLRLEYRFIGHQTPGAPEWAIRNSGAMLHSQAPDSMLPEQDFPISIEAQFLGGLSNGEERSTGNLCTPGTHVVMNGVFTEQHCISSTSPTLDGDQWVSFEALVRRDEHFEHFVNGELVLEYSDATTGGGVVSGFRPELKPEDESLGTGYISLQSEGHAIQFRNVLLLDLAE